jgi:serine/threonine protein kinase
MGALSPRFPGTIVEFCEGTRLPLDHLSIVFNQIELALRSLHSVSLVHCDVKPPNLFLDNECNTYLGDFGSMTDIGDELNRIHRNFGLMR